MGKYHDVKKGEVTGECLNRVLIGRGGVRNEGVVLMICCGRAGDQCLEKFKSEGSIWRTRVCFGA